jgi:type VI secretion system protein ImpL
MAAGEPTWTARDHAGPQPALFFDLNGAFAPGAGVPRLFTRDGYERTFLPMLAEGPTLLKEEKWVVGDTGAPELSPAQLGTLKADLERLYFDEFLDRWNSYLAGLRARPVNDLRDNLLRLRGASSPTSPIPPLFRAIVAATDLTPSAAARKANTAATGALNAKLGTVGAAALRGSVPADGAADARANVIAAFQPLRQFVGPPPAAGSPGSGPLDATLATMAQLANKLTMVEQMGGADPSAPTAAEAKAIIAQLDQEAVSMPGPLAALVRDVAGDASAALTGQRRAQFDQAVGSSFGDACRQAITSRYPVAGGAVQDISLEDFARFFSPTGGAFARFAQQNGGAIDMSGPTWQARPAAAEVGLTQDSVGALQAAQTVGRIFFSIDPTRPQLSYEIIPVAITGAKQVTLRLDGSAMSFAPGTTSAAAVDWPGEGDASIEFERENAPAEVKKWSGPWAAFRLMQAAGVKGSASAPTAEGRVQLGEASFQFRVRTVGVGNPFGSNLLAQIRCPATS